MGGGNSKRGRTGTLPGPVPTLYYKRTPNRISRNSWHQLEILSPFCNLVGMVLGKNNPYGERYFALCLAPRPGSICVISAHGRGSPLAYVYVSIDPESRILTANLPVTANPFVIDLALATPEIYVLGLIRTVRLTGTTSASSLRWNGFARGEPKICLS